MTSIPAAPGRDAENLAAKELSKRGYRILERNVRLPGGEIDIVATEGDCLVFVEVKSLKDPREGYQPYRRADKKKRMKLVGLSRQFCKKKSLTDRPVRFDLASVVYRSGKTEIEIFKRAFDADGRWL